MPEDIDLEDLWEEEEEEEEGDEEEEEAPDIEIDDAFVNATRAFTEAKSDEERAKALKGAIKLCLSEEGY